jgi:hypothetical protein
VTSKARQVVGIIIAPHDTPPWLGGLGTRGDMTARLSDVQGFALPDPTYTGCTTAGAIARPMNRPTDRFEAPADVEPAAVAKSSAFSLSLHFQD